MGLIKTAAKGIAWTTISTIVRSLISILQVSILTRYLQKSDFGIVAIATLLIGFIQIFLDLGLSVGIMHKRDTTKDEYSSLFWLNVFCGIFLTIIIALISPLIASFYKEPSLTRIVTLLGFSMLFSSLGSQHRTIQQKLMRFKTISIVEIIASFFTILAAVLLAINGYGIYSLVYSTLINVFISNILFLIIGLRKDNNISFHFAIRDTYPYIKIGVYSLGTQILDFVSRELDVFIISTSLGKDILGAYSLCKRLILALYNALNPILMKVLTPILSTLQDDNNRLKGIYYKIIESIALINYPIYCLIAIFAYAILSILYGNDYSEYWIILGLLSVYYAYLSTGNPVGALQTALGRTDTGFYWTMCRIVIYGITIYVGSFWGMMAIIIGLIISNFIFAPLAWKITIKPLIGGRFWEFFKIGFIPWILTILYSSPFILLFAKQKNIIVCIVISVVYLGLYLSFLLIQKREIYIVGLLKNGLVRLRQKYKL